MWVRKNQVCKFVLVKLKILMWQSMETAPG